MKKRNYCNPVHDPACGPPVTMNSPLMRVRRASKCELAPVISACVGLAWRKGAEQSGAEGSRAEWITAEWSTAKWSEQGGSAKGEGSRPEGKERAVEGGRAAEGREEGKEVQRRGSKGETEGS